MRKIILTLCSTLIFLFSSYSFADEGYGYKIVGEHHWVKNTKDLPLVDLPVKKKLSTPRTVAVTASARDVNAPVGQYVEIDSWHGAYISNNSNTKLRYNISFYLRSGIVESSYGWDVDLEPGGYFSKEALLPALGRATARGKYDIYTNTKIAGAESTIIEAHATFTAT